MSIRNSACVILLVALSSAGADDARPRLRFSHRIGPDWPADNYFWMSFVAISADGATVAADGRTPEGAAGGAGLWSLSDGKFIRRVSGHPRALSANFKLIATEEGLVDLKSGKRLAQLPKEYSPSAFSPDGEYLAFVPSQPAAGASGPHIRVIRTAGGSPVREFGRRYTAALAIHPDNHTLASGHWDNVTLWNMLSGERIALLAGIGRYVSGVAFSRDGRWLAAGTDDGNLQIWDVAGRRRTHALRVGWEYVSTPAFSPDGKLVAAGTYADGTVTLVDVASGAILSQIQVSMFGCGSVAFSPDGRYLVTPSNSGPLQSGRFEKGGSIRVFEVTR